MKIITPQTKKVNIALFTNTTTKYLQTILCHDFDPKVLFIQNRIHSA